MFRFESLLDCDIKTTKLRLTIKIYLEAVIELGWDQDLTKKHLNTARYMKKKYFSVTYHLYLGFTEDLLEIIVQSLKRCQNKNFDVGIS